MISRSASMAIASAYTGRFTYRSSSGRGVVHEKVYRDHVYDFLYENDYEAWFCNLAKAPVTIRAFKEFWLKIHTGESIVSATNGWSWQQRQKLGQRLLVELARDFLRWYETIKLASTRESYRDEVEEIRRRLELDGYTYRDGDLLQTQSDVLNVEEEAGLLQALYSRSGLARSSDAFDFMRLGEEHFVAGRWSDSISNVRKFFELTLQEGARVLGRVRSAPLDEASLKRPVEVRQYLERQGLVEKKEREAIDKLYGLLSETGAHPYMAESDQARLLRQLSLTLSQFVLLRLEMATAARPAGAA
ncbi:hypothetical protein KDW36_29260 [Burkholderia dolosa]|uniref:hypothetical protein n=1 Tax=Burkholderia dolosa TaxID=152500 RepID=UPI001B9A7793|nr:hypothetical protein [Burkholderia dolosa]MBR8317257.1 hypothetical protein [Burkholderia dolosa]